MKKRTVLVAIEKKEDSVLNLGELAALIESIDCEPITELVQKRVRADHQFYVGKGKLETLKQIINEQEIVLAVIDDELTPLQQRNLERILEIDVIDRTAVILEIFARRARSKEGKLQVELAQMKYLMPRLIGAGKEMSRLGGGIGTRGPGERKLEMDRRVIRGRIRAVEKEIELLKHKREVTRKQRENQETPIVSLVGYTNAGKSSLMSKLTGVSVYADDLLFATLDTTSRRVPFSSGGYFLLNDTVGFIQKLPHQLIAAFRATLEEVTQADLLLHVVDAAMPGLHERVRVVEQVLKQVTDEPKQMLMVFNKTDLLSETEIQSIFMDWPGSVAVSAASGFGLDQLVKKIETIVFEDEAQIEVIIPFARLDLLNTLYKNALIIEREETPEGVRVITRGRANILGAVTDQLERITGHE